MSVVLIGLFLVLLGFALVAVLICCCFWYLCCKAVMNGWKAHRRREGRSVVPNSRTPLPDYSLRDFFPQRNRENVSRESTMRRSPHVTPPPDYSTIDFFPQLQLQQNNNPPTYEEAVAAEK